MEERRTTYHVPRTTYRKLLLSVVCCLSFVAIFAAPAYAGRTGGIMCEDAGSKCYSDQGNGACPAGTVKHLYQRGDVMEEPSCPDGQNCCKGTPTEGAGGTCPSGQSYTKPGLGAARCGTNQCRDEGYLYFTDCMKESDCAVNRGTTDGGNIAGCSGEGISCCRIKKNRCNDGSKDPKKIFLCTTPSECTAKSGTPFAGGPSGCGGTYSTCCEFGDAINATMLNAGAPLVGYGAGGPTGGSTSAISRTARKYQNINSFCFTEIECINASGVGAWKQNGVCPSKGNTPQGYCVAPKPEYELQYPIGGVKTIAGLKNFITLIFNYGMSIIIIVAAVLFVYGGLRYMVAAVSNDVQVGKTIMIDAAMGLLMGLGAYAILANVNFNTVNLRDFDVYMINKLSFFDNLYCDAVTPAPGKSAVMFQDAGTPFVPKELDITKGYTLTLKDTKCGEEYFVEGSDSLSVCAGTSCGKGACLNCASGSNDCRSDSDKEHVCVDANIAGNVIVGGGQNWVKADWKNIKIEPVIFCDKGASQDFKELSSAPITDKKITQNIVSGRVGAYAVELNLEDIKSFMNSCSGKSGLLLEYHFDTGGLMGLSLGGSWYTYISKDCAVNPKGDFFSLRVFSGNLFSSSAFSNMSQDNRTKYLSGAWTLDEILATDKTPIVCQIKYDASGIDNAGSTGLGDNWHD
ncbi:MAG: hypothetical protein WC766_04210 [Patescibacteria group bacterium]